MSVLEEIFLKILTMGMAASAVIVFVMLVRGSIMRNFPKRYTYLLWLIVGARLICPITISSSVSIFNLWHYIQKAPFVQEAFSDEPVADTYEEKKMPAGDTKSPVVDVDSLPAADTHSKTGKTNRMQETENQTAEDDLQAVGTQADRAVFSDGQKLPDGLLSFLCVIWLFGMLILLFWNVFLYIRTKQKISRAVLYHDNIFECDAISSPFVMGLVKPRIYIPFRLDGQEREYILEHERYHIKRHDYIVNILAFLIVLVYWFYPLVWLAYFYMKRDMEMSCDEYVLANIDTDIRKDYSRSLLAFATNKRSLRMNIPAFGESDTRKRVMNIMKFNVNKKRRWFGAVSAVLLLLTGAICMTNANAVRDGSNISSDERRGVNADNGSKEYENTDSAEKLIYLTGDIAEAEENEESDIQRKLHKAVNATMPQDIAIEVSTGVWHEITYGEKETGYLLTDSDNYDNITLRLDFTIYEKTLIRYVCKDYGFVGKMKEKSVGKKKAVLLVQKFAEKFTNEKLGASDIAEAELPPEYDSKNFMAFTDPKGNSYIVQLNRGMVVQFEISDRGTGVIYNKMQEIKEKEQAKDAVRDKQRKERENTVMLAYMAPDSGAESPKYYVPEGKEQEMLRKLVAKLDASHVSNKKDIKRAYQGKEKGYKINYGGNVWNVLSGGYVDLESGEMDDVVVIPALKLCYLSQEILEKNVAYSSATPEEIRNITSAEVVHSTDGINHTSQGVTDKKSLRKIEKLLSSGEYIKGAGCPFGEAVLTLRRDGKKDICVTLATDSCAVFRMNGVYYDYGSIKNSDSIKKIFDRIKWRR